MPEATVGPAGPSLLLFVMLKSDHQCRLPVGLQNLLESTAASNPFLGGALSAVLQRELAMATLVAIGPVCIFLFAQRAFVTGMLAGATKG